MSSSLFNFASRAIRQAAQDRFQRTSLAKLVKEIESAARKGSLTSGEVSRFSRRLSALTGEGVAKDLLGHMGFAEVERYARPGRGWFGSFLDQIGPVGKLIKSFTNIGKKSGGSVSQERELQAAGAFLKAFGHVVLPPADAGGASREQQREMGNLLRAMGWKVEEPAEQDTGGQKGGQAGRPRRTTDVDFGGAKLRNRIRNTDPLITGEMIPVESSNVHSIGFRLDPDDNPNDALQSKGTLLIRFLADRGKGKKAGPGPLYEYYDVPASLFQAFRRASSKGGFVWDEVRVRGTVSGHKYSYDLAGITGGYVPRQAGIKRGEQGEFFMTRRFREGGQVFTSRLPEQRVSDRGPNRGTPNRAEPNRGR